MGQQRRLKKGEEEMVGEGLGPGGPHKNINTRTSPNCRQSPGQAMLVGWGGDWLRPGNNMGLKIINPSQ